MWLVRIIFWSFAVLIISAIVAVVSKIPMEGEGSPLLGDLFVIGLIAMFVLAGIAAEKTK